MSKEKLTNKEEANNLIINSNTIDKEFFKSNTKESELNKNKCISENEVLIGDENKVIEAQLDFVGKKRKKELYSNNSSKFFNENKNLENTIQSKSCSNASPKIISYTNEVSDLSSITSISSFNFQSTRLIYNNNIGKESDEFSFTISNDNENNSNICLKYKGKLKAKINNKNSIKVAKEPKNNENPNNNGISKDSHINNIENEDINTSINKENANTTVTKNSSKSSFDSSTESKDNNKSPSIKVETIHIRFKNLINTDINNSTKNESTIVNTITENENQNILQSKQKPIRTPENNITYFRKFNIKKLFKTAIINIFGYNHLKFLNLKLFLEIINKDLLLNTIYNQLFKNNFYHLMDIEDTTFNFELKFLMEIFYLNFDYKTIYMYYLSSKNSINQALKKNDKEALYYNSSVQNELIWNEKDDEKLKVLLEEINDFDKMCCLTFPNKKSGAIKDRIKFLTLY